MPELRPKVGWLVDVAADFRLHDAALYPQWYGEAHTAPDLLGEFAYGLPELFRDRDRQGHRRRRARLLPDGVDPGPRPAGGGRA